MRRLIVCNAGFWTRPRLRRILALAGWQVAVGWPRAGDAVGVWGAAPTAWRGRALAQRAGVPVLTVEDAFLRAVLPARAGGPVARRGPIGLLIDPLGWHPDPARPSLLTARVADGMTRQAEAAAALQRLRAADLSKYNAHRPDAPLPPAGAVVIVDQVRADAALLGAGRAVFLRMLDAARAENPGAPIVIRAHPETVAGGRPGHLTPADLRPGEMIHAAAASPWAILGRAARVYAVSSQLGYEAILAEHRPRLFGAPFFAGWGLSDDEPGAPARGTATPAALFAASHLLAPVWYDPCLDRLTDLDGALRQIEAEARAFREDADGHVALGFRRWKRGATARAFGGRVRFTARPSDAVTLVWASHPAARGPLRARRVEDGFLRSRGLGAALVPAVSLVADGRGIHYDPAAPSDLEGLIAAGPPPGGRARAAALVAALVAGRATKYGPQAGAPALPPRDGRPRLLVAGQVEDDAAMRCGATGPERTNAALLARARAEHPDALLLWRAHPDVTAGLRDGAVPASLLGQLGAVAVPGGDPAALLDAVDGVITITSTLGFEALLRGVPVTVLGAPFYAGWGLTRDLGPVPARRTARPDLTALAWAALVAYPRYTDPLTGLPCPVETALARLTGPAPPLVPPPLRMLARIQRIVPPRFWLWR